MKNTNLTLLALLVITGTLHANQFPNLIPTGEVTHTYQDGNGNHTVHYEAHPQGTFKNLQRLRMLHRLRVGAGITGAVTCAMAAALGGPMEVVSQGLNGYPDRAGSALRVLTSTALCGALAIASGIYGARALSRVRSLSRILKSHDANPPFSTESLNNPVLTMKSFEWYMKSKQTTPIRAHVQK